jgi:hypothetical protein
MGLTGDNLELAVGQETLERMITFPVILIVLFTILYFWVGKKRKPNRVTNKSLEIIRG